MQVVEYQRSMGSHTTAIGAHETSFHYIGEDIHVIHSRVVDTEFDIDIETIRGKWSPVHLWDYGFTSDTPVDQATIETILEDLESQEIVHHAVLKPVRKYRPGYIATISLRIN